ncbi:glycosyltransferase [uncultured Ilyobacter sp.]|uniref:glycosyltransferase n=1 Tax=uncultured Ilyobacter sp. TaxID=544433 RepID=UPI002AA7EF0C|nr:glycosyltransferase [uncultured Ilyobacter sp.]
MKFTGERFVPGVARKEDEIYIEHYHRYFAVKNICSNKKVVDIASGEGYGSFILADTADKVLGLDISLEAIENAQLKYKKENLEYKQGSVEEIPIENESIDVVVSFETLEHVSEELQKKFLKEIKRVLKKDGILVISTPDKQIYSDIFNYKNEFHEKEFYKEEFISFLKPYFNHMELFYQKMDIYSIIKKSYNIDKEILNIVNPDSNILNSGKYLIAICSDGQLKFEGLNSLFLHSSEDELINKNKRILDLQDEVEELGRWGKNQDKEIEKLRVILEEKTQLADKLERVRNINMEKSKEIDSLKEEVEKHKGKIVLMKGLEKELEECKEEKTQLADELERVRNINMEKSKEIDSLKEEVEKHKGKIVLMKGLEKELEECKEEKTQLADKLERVRNINMEKSKEIDSLRKWGSDLHENNEDVKIIINDLNEELFTVGNWGKNTDKQLNEFKSELNEIKNSRGFRLLLKYYSIQEIFIPSNSKRRKLLELNIYMMKNPLKTLKKINIRNLQLLQKKIYTDDPKTLISKVDKNINQSFGMETLQTEIEGSNANLNKESSLCLKKSDNPLVTIIIPAYNQYQYNINCIKSIIENTKDVEYEVILVDDVSTDKTKDIGDVVKNLRIIKNETNQGFLRNCNNAAKQAKGKYIFYLNNDTVVTKGWLSSLVELIESEKKIGMVGSKLIYPDGTLQEAGGIFWKDGSAWNYGRNDDPSKPEYNYVREVDYISGAAIMIKKSLWNEIGGFDERYLPAYCEDADLAFEVRRRGYKVVYQPKSVIVHFEGKSHGTDTTSGIKKYQVENLKKLKEKWKNELEKNHYPNGENILKARGRTKDKKHILIIDHYVPHYDQDAGSKCTYNYIKMFIKMGYKVTFLGDNFYKHEPYTTDLQQLGVNVLYGNWYYNNHKEWLKENLSNFEYVYLNRPHISIKYIDFIKKYSNTKIIYFGHDLHFIREERNYEFEKDVSILETAKEWKKVELKLFSESDIVFAVGSYEMEVIKNLVPNKPVINIPVYLYDKFNKFEYKMEQRKDLMFVGGYGHKPNVDATLWFVNEILPLIHKKIPDLKIYLIGSNPTQEILDLQNERVIVTGFISDEELEKYYRNCRKAVVPLRYGAGMKGKVLEALYNQIPLVTTSVGAEGIDGINKVCSVVDEKKLFAQTIIDLYNNPIELKRMSEESLEFISTFSSEESVIKSMKKNLGGGQLVK